jgi:large subunit ribosomal protein L18|tara:strand:+ start:247 stop:603 length:357 start_codon:yes stop_codon:yes gene_type:complete
MSLKNKNLLRQKRTRYKIKKNSDRPRMTVFRSAKNIYVQIIDDNNGKTLISASTIEKKIKSSLKKTTDINAASEIGKLIAEKAKEKGIKKVVFDRGKYLFHGRIKALAEGARKGGLDF